MKRHRQSPHLNLAFQHLWIQAPYCSIEWKQPDHQFSEEHALQHTGTKPEHTKWQRQEDVMNWKLLSISAFSWQHLLSNGCQQKHEHGLAFQQIAAGRSASFHPQVSHFHLLQQSGEDSLLADLTAESYRYNTPNISRNEKQTGDHRAWRQTNW